MKKRKVRKKKTTTKSVYYKSAMIKKDNKILWRAVEMPTGLVLKESFFEEDVKKIVKFQNKNKTFGRFGFPKCFDCRSDDEINSSQR